MPERAGRGVPRPIESCGRAGHRVCNTKRGEKKSKRGKLKREQ